MSDAEEAIVFFFDVDNTLLDNDAVQHDLHAHVARTVGAEADARYSAHLEALREELGYVDYLGAFQRLRLDHQDDPRFTELAEWLLDCPFAERLYPGALEVLKHLGEWGPTVLLSDGDAVFQPHKVRRSGLWDAVDGRVLIHVHKEEQLDAVARRYPARHYVMVDDKPRILAAMKPQWGARLTTVLPRQGHYAHDPAELRRRPLPDVTVDRIGDLLAFDLSTFLPAAPAAQESR